MFVQSLNLSVISSDFADSFDGHFMDDASSATIVKRRLTAYREGSVTPRLQIQSHILSTETQRSQETKIQKNS